ncbi:uncharacterized protein LOC113293752 isoform X5 [Papaver somniferum]|uniref:uncharacterized protein LOC113293752 isoform X5 n=1 Tax=Papaver somniferum TaxID=3469 RepID=UPI000E70054D|nr:uncharacterized protein LOC113293752 isoform X5 [Papaver somniferum]
MNDKNLIFKLGWCWLVLFQHFGGINGVSFHIFVFAGRNGAAPAVMSLKRLFCKLWGSNKNTNILPTTIQYHKEFVQERKLLEYLLLL